MAQIPRHVDPSDLPGGARGNALAEIQSLVLSTARIRATLVALELGVFSMLRTKSRTASELALEANVPIRGMRMVLDTLATIGFLTKLNDQFSLSPHAAQYLVKESPEYVGSWIGLVQHEFERLAECVRGGTPQRLADERYKQSDPVAVFKPFHLFHSGPAARFAEQLSKVIPPDRELNILDIGAGSGVWSLALAATFPNCRVTAVDLAPALKATRTFVGNAGVSARYDFVEGDVRTVALESARFDLVLFGNVLHLISENEARDAIGGVTHTLRPGGQLVVFDILVDEGRCGPEYSIFFSLAMLLFTNEGDGYTRAQYEGWLRDADLPKIEALDIGWFSPALVARRG